jgi:hypothetical protein
MQVSEIELFQILKEKVGEEQALTLTDCIGAKIQNQIILNADILETKKKSELAELRNEFYLEINKRRVETIQLLFFVVIVLILISTMLIGFNK